MLAGWEKARKTFEACARQPGQARGGNRPMGLISWRADTHPYCGIPVFYLQSDLMTGYKLSFCVIGFPKQVELFLCSSSHGILRAASRGKTESCGQLGEQEVPRKACLHNIMDRRALSLSTSKVDAHALDSSTPVRQRSEPHPSGKGTKVTHLVDVQGRESNNIVHRPLSLATTNSLLWYDRHLTCELPSALAGTLADSFFQMVDGF
jgi:hypothetical protein